MTSCRNPKGSPNPQVKEREMLKYVEISRPLGSALSAEFDHQNYYGQFTVELGGDPTLCPAEPYQFSAVVDKIMYQEIMLVYICCLILNDI